jgi:hypothetical protein
MSEQLPAELWHKIFQHACVDGGRTGCALSLVSRRLHDLSVGTRLQSVFIIDLERLKLFLHTLERLPEHERRVRFLFIAARCNEEVETRRVQLALSRLQLGSHVESLSSELEDFEEQQKDVVQEWRTVYPAVLALVAPHVEVLTIHTPQLLLNSVFPPNIRFPVLHDLTFGQMKENDQFSCMPLLRRLHVFDYPTKAMIHSVIDMHGLQHVRFSGYRALHESVVTLGKHSARTSCASGPIRSTKLIITSDRGFRHEHACRQRDSLMQHQNGGRFGAITILEPSASKYNPDIAAKDWRDVVENGGEGAWGNFEEQVLPTRAAQGTTEEAPRSTHGRARRTRGSRDANGDSEPRAISVGFGLGLGLLGRTRGQFNMGRFSTGQQENSAEAGQAFGRQTQMHASATPEIVRESQ